MFDFQKTGRQMMALFFLLFVLPSHAVADESWQLEAYRLYESGSYIEAAELALQHPSSDAKSFAARSYLTQVTSVEPRSRRLEIIGFAQDAAESALELDPKNVEALVQKAIAIGLQGTEMGVLKAFSSGIAHKVRDTLEAALAIDPDDPWALSTLGGWHMEVERRGGRIGRLIYGASRQMGSDYLERALFSAPNSIPVRQRYAALLIATNDKALHDRAAQILSRAKIILPRSQYDRATLQDCLELEAPLLRGDTKEAVRVAVGQLQD